MAKRIILGESGGPTPVIDWEVAGAIDAAQKKGWEIYGMINGLEGLLNANIEGNIVNLTNIDPMSFSFNGPGAGLGTTRIKPKKDQYVKMAEHLKEFGIDAVVYFGGNDSSDQLLGLGECAEGVTTIHGIKTIDNDLPVTHHSPGYGSATLFNTTALKNVHSDFASYKVKANFMSDGKIVQGYDVAPVAIYQVMGRKAGWLAQGTGFAKVDPKGEVIADNPPHIILSKEIPFDEEEFLAKLDQVITRLGEAVVIVQEDMTDKATGESLAKIHSKSVVTDSHGNIQHGRSDSFQPGIFIAKMIDEKLKVKSVFGKVKDTALVPQHIQRSCMMSAVDASEAYKVGSSCVEAIDKGLSKKSVILLREGGRTITDVTDMSNIAAKDRSVPIEYINKLDGLTQEFVDEYIYLIGGPAAIPHYSQMIFKSVAIPEAITKNPYIANK
jgi:ATP-dependent phosphofructokinase / diphosphate-dependent phosphofructokinase